MTKKYVGLFNDKSFSLQTQITLSYTCNKRLSSNKYTVWCWVAFKCWFQTIGASRVHACPMSRQTQWQLFKKIIKRFVGVKIFGVNKSFVSFFKFLPVLKIDFWRSKNLVPKFCGLKMLVVKFFRGQQFWGQSFGGCRNGMIWESNDPIWLTRYLTPFNINR